MPPSGATLATAGAAAARTVADARRALTASFRANGLDTPELDARLLVGHVLSLDHARLAASDRRLLDTDETNAIAAMAARRLAHEPVARIIGFKEFWSLQFGIDAATLVPRPETETVVEAALAAIENGGPRSRDLRILDIGTGSGAILLALLTELPNAFGVGSDVSLSALAVARDNARRFGLSRAAFLACHMAAALCGPFDLIVSNPPYIASGDIAALPPEVRLFDPKLALDGGADGLDGYRDIAASGPSLLKPGGSLIVELGAGQAEKVAALFASGGLAPAPPRPDLSNLPRALVGEKPAI
ncbi:MAG TPA: peptide chain release factor N(5)-glutamine methyltransferase [Xanthobacteraceae bacterium]|jgi:release factor glutamine methyltransferase